MKLTLRSAAFYIMTAVLGVVFLMPLIYTAASSFMGSGEISYYYQNEAKSGSLHLIPDMISLESYYNVFIKQPDYLMKFWTSLMLSTAIVAGQVTVAVLGGYGFAKFKFKGRNTIFFFYIVFMLLPLQVTLVTNYFVLMNMSLIGSYWAVILPGVFSTFGVFLMRQFAAAIPNDALEACRLDGAGHLRTFFTLVLPQCRAGIAALVILGFIDSWNMVEQPLVFLNDPMKHPLSIFLTYIRESEISLVFVCSVLAIIPALLLFLNFEEELVKGIENSVNL